MKKLIFVYGLIAGGIIITIITISIMLWDPSSSHAAGIEWLGYVIMVAALSLVFFGVKSYRDNELGGVISFWDALKVGLGITLVASAVYVAGWETYLQVSDSDFMEEYATAYIENLKAEGASAEDLAEAEALMDSYKQMYANAFSRLGITFLEIFPVGLIIALISAALLRKSDLLPAGNTMQADAG